jgi:hypothetical protein
MGATDLKSIVYRGGVVRFRIPADWQEEYESDGGGTFYAPGDETGTLRLNVTTFRSPAGKVLQLTDAEEFLTQVALKHGSQVQLLRPGVAMVRYDLPTKDRGHALIIRYWQVAQVLLPGHVRQSLFSYTLPAKLFDDWLLRHEMDLLEREIHVAEFAQAFGEVPRSS